MLKAETNIEIFWMIFNNEGESVALDWAKENADKLNADEKREISMAIGFYSYMRNM